jgi:hypothetical protein
MSPFRRLVYYPPPWPFEETPRRYLMTSEQYIIKEVGDLHYKLRAPRVSLAPTDVNET